MELPINSGKILTRSVSSVQSNKQMLFAAEKVWMFSGKGAVTLSVSYCSNLSVFAWPLSDPALSSNNVNLYRGNSIEGEEAGIDLS